jgi:hypothetical protein
MSDMIDDRGGLYSHASEAIAEGKAFGRDELFLAVQAKLRAMSVKYEPQADPTAFHVAQEACRALNEAKAELDAPRKDGASQ